MPLCHIKSRSYPPRLRFPDDLGTVLKAERFLELPVLIKHTAALRHLPLLHRDPFDRLLIAQAQLERLHVIAADPVFERYGVPVMAD